MKRILTAIDFSRGSIHALDYSIHLANQTQADIVLVWVDNHSESEPAYHHYSNELRKEAKQNFEALMKEYDQKLSHGSLKFKLRRGKVAQEIASVAKNEEADLIVAGTHGGSGYEEYWIGSNANRIVMMAPCPVITVNHLFDNKVGIHNIVLPIDSTTDTRKKVPVAVEVAKLFSAEVHIIGVYTTNLNTFHKRVDMAVEKVKEACGNENIPFKSSVIQAQNVTTATINYIEENHADLVVIMTEQDSSTQNRLLGQYAQQMVNLSPVPVLSIHPLDTTSE